MKHTRNIVETQTELSDYFDITPFLFDNAMAMMLKAFTVQKI
jgi:hypothetical protein